MKKRKKRKKKCSSIWFSPQCWQRHHVLEQSMYRIHHGTRTHTCPPPPPQFIIHVSPKLWWNPNRLTWNCVSVINIYIYPKKVTNSLLVKTLHVLFVWTQCVHPSTTKATWNLSAHFWYPRFRYRTQNYPPWSRPSLRLELQALKS